jgi:hypothetical protein
MHSKSFQPLHGASPKLWPDLFTSVGRGGDCVAAPGIRPSPKAIRNVKSRYRGNVMSISYCAQDQGSDVMLAIGTGRFATKVELRETEINRGISTKVENVN